MKTKKQEEIVYSFLSALGDEVRPLYQDIVVCLSELGYYPQKEKSNISFKHDLHHKQIAKMGIKNNKALLPFFALRFSACRDYSQRFADIVGAAITKYPHRAARCPSGGCNFCKGEAVSHIYTYMFPDGESKAHCGSVALEIQKMTVDDIEEIKKLIQEEHAYLVKHEAGLPVI